MIHLNSQQFHKRIDSLLRKFKPNNEVFEAKRIIGPLEDLDLIIVAEQEPGTVILAEGAAREYMVRINKGSVDVWHSLKANGLRGPLECIVSFLEIGKKESYDLEEGVMKKTQGYSMPLFIYNQTKPPERSALKPQGPWIDKYEHIYVWKKA